MADVVRSSLSHYAYHNSSDDVFCCFLIVNTRRLTLWFTSLGRVDLNRSIKRKRARPSSIHPRLRTR